jgi:hypothetical protein
MPSSAARRGTGERSRERRGCFVFGVVFVAVQPKSTAALAILTGFLERIRRSPRLPRHAFADSDRGLVAATLNVTLHVALA